MYVNFGRQSNRDTVNKIQILYSNDCIVLLAAHIACEKYIFCMARECERTSVLNVEFNHVILFSG